MNLTNLELEIQALKLLKDEYKNAISNNASFLTLLDIKTRLENIKELYNNDLIEQLTNKAA